MDSTEFYEFIDPMLKNIWFCENKRNREIKCTMSIDF